MNCQSVQSQILSGASPERLSPEVIQHLRDCADCRLWHARLVRVERALPEVPVPPSHGPGELLRQLLEPQGHPVRPSSARLREWGRQKVALAFALAASLLVFALGFWVWPHHADSEFRPDSYLARRNQYLGQAHTHGDRVVVLANFADDLLRQARTLEDEARLKEVEQSFIRLVRRDLLDYARRVPPEERRTVLNEVANRLRNSESEASRLAADLVGHRADSLRAIARAARAGDEQLRALVPAAQG
jgi:hypothetical protein